LLETIKKYPLVYLATPYSKSPAGLYDAFTIAAKITGRLLRDGIKVYSPIAHGHPISIHANIDPYDHDIWMPFDEAMMDAAAAIVVVKLTWWDESKGIDHEIRYFKRAQKPVWFLDPETFEYNEVA